MFSIVYHVVIVYEVDLTQSRLDWTPLSQNRYLGYIHWIWCWDMNTDLILARELAKESRWYFLLYFYQRTAFIYSQKLRLESVKALECENEQKIYYE